MGDPAIEAAIHCPLVATCSRQGDPAIEAAIRIATIHRHARGRRGRGPGEPRCGLPGMPLALAPGQGRQRGGRGSRVGPGTSRGSAGAGAPGGPRRTGAGRREALALEGASRVLARRAGRAPAGRGLRGRRTVRPTRGAARRRTPGWRRAPRRHPGASPARRPGPDPQAPDTTRSKVGFASRASPSKAGGRDLAARTRSLPASSESSAPAATSWARTSAALTAERPFPSGVQPARWPPLQPFHRKRGGGCQRRVLEPEQRRGDVGQCVPVEHHWKRVSYDLPWGNRGKWGKFTARRGRSPRTHARARSRARSHGEPPRSR